MEPVLPEVSDPQMLVPYFPLLGIDVWSLPARFLLHYAGFADLCVEPEVFPEVSGPPVRWEVYHHEEP